VYPSRFRRSALATVAALSALAMSAGATAAATPARAVKAASASVLTWILPQNPDHLIPEMGSLAADNNPDSLLWDGLVRMNLNGQWVPDLATSWTHSKNGKVWTFFLRHGVKWSDGQPFTAADVAYTYAFVSNPKINTTYVTGFNDIAKLATPNQYEVVYTLKKPLAMFLADVAGSSILPAHIYSKLTPTEINDGKYPSAEAPIGTGPYTVQSWVQNSTLTMVANPNYWGPKPKIQKIVFEIVTNPNTAAVDLESGNVEIDQDIPPQYVNAAKGWSGVRLYQSINATYDLIQLDEFHFLKDQNVRVALNLDTPKAQIVAKIMKGQAVVAYGDQVPGGIWYDPHLPHPGYDPSKALALLLKDGFKKVPTKGAPAGFWLSKDGQRLSVPLWTIAADQSEDDIALVVSEAWEAIGVYAPVTTLSVSDLFGQNGPQFNGKDEALIFSWGQGVFPDDQIDFNWAEYPCTSATSNSEDCERYSNTEMDALTEEGAYTVNQAKAQQIYDKIQSLEISTVPIIFLFWYDGYAGVSSNVVGYKATVYGTTYPWTWSLK
jgi:peptide/nickel transport system substrate-binding protein